MLTNFLLAFSSISFLSLACTPTHRVAIANALPFAATAAIEWSSLDQTSDNALTVVRRADAAEKTTDGSLPTLSPEEHARRASVYSANRLFDEARGHWLALVNRYPQDIRIPAALFGIGRAYYQQRRFAEALPYFERGGREYAHTEEGRDSFYYVAPTLLRLNRAADAAAKYVEHINRFPQGERIESAHLNAIDTYREAGNTNQALSWIERTRAKYRGTPTDTNALFARLRLEIANNKWKDAVTTADELARARFVPGVSTSTNEVFFLRAYAYEQVGRKDEAIRLYTIVPDGLTSYYGGRATERLMNLGNAARALAMKRQLDVRIAAEASTGSYPTPFRTQILSAVKDRSVDPRFMLAVMRQESGFRPSVKSSAAARGLMQLTVDTAARYAPKAGLPTVTENDLYRPDINVLVASQYIADLKRMFPNSLEAVAASYNGGEDNAERWLRRASQTEPGIFAAEVGFSETKTYVHKVMANYRVYRLLYTNELLTQKTDD